MAVTLTLAALSGALRLGDSAAEQAEAVRLLAYATEAVERHAPSAPAATQNEAVIRLGHTCTINQTRVGACPLPTL